jgi:hypothetical protein
MLALDLTLKLIILFSYFCSTFHTVMNMFSHVSSKNISCAYSSIFPSPCQLLSNYFNFLLSRWKLWGLWTYKIYSVFVLLLIQWDCLSFNFSDIIFPDDSFKCGVSLDKNYTSFRKKVTGKLVRRYLNNIFP